MGPCGTSVQVMVISLGAGTHVFQLDRALGEFVLTKNRIKMPARGGCDERWNDCFETFGRSTRVAIPAVSALRRSRITLVSIIVWIESRHFVVL